MDLDPAKGENGKVPLVIAIGAISLKSFVAFDSTLDMLRSVCAAHDAGIFQYIEHKIEYDYAEVWDVIKQFNPNSNYWREMISGPIDWEVEYPPDLQGMVKSGIIRMPRI